MKKLFTNSIIAILAKEKGFDEDCLAYYTHRFAGGKETPIAISQHEGSGIGGDKNSDFKGNKYFLATAPLYQQLVDFVNLKGVSLQYGIISLSLLDKQLEECLNKLEYTK